MKHFTRELIEMGRSRDPAILDRQEALWDAACERYFDQLDALKGELPSGLRRLVEGYYLHDAVVRGMGQQGKTFVIHLQLDTPPQSLLTLTYELVEEPGIDREVLGPEYRGQGGQVEWRHDEIERGEGTAPTWRQSILFSNGWEVGLHFRDVTVQEVAALIPAPRNGQSVLSTEAVRSAV